MENIQVSLRLRPLNLKESLSQERNYWQISEKSSNISLFTRNVPDFSQFKRGPSKNVYSFTFDQCFPEDSNNQAIYEKCVRKLVESSLIGINGTVFMYGQTGAGKTYTMLGPRQGNCNENYAECSNYSEKISVCEEIRENSGILLLALNDFFELIEKDRDKSYIIRCSYIEIYNENTYDLLSSECNEVLSIVEDVNRKEFFVKGVNEILVNSRKEIIEILKKGEINRHYALTNLNHSSSRSHTIFSIKLKSIANNACSLTESQLNFVDLAGSEKLSNYHVADESVADRDYLSDNGGTTSEIASCNNFAQRLKEGQSINKSLFFLTHVISLRSEGKTSTHIPYRNSPLTKILRSSLGGNSRTLIILCITPALIQLEQSLSTMRFGMQAKKIENKIQANIITSPNENETIKLLMEDFELKIKQLEKERLEDKEKIRNLTNELNGKPKFLHEKPKKPLENSQNNPVEIVDKAGIVFLPATLQRKHKEISELLTRNLKKNWQDLIFDCEGKIALESYKKLKSLQELFHQNQQQYERNFQQILKEYLELQEKFFLLEQKKFDYKTKAKTLYLKYNVSQKELSQIKTRVILLETCEGIAKLTNKEILALEELFSKGLVHCQNERLNRVTKKISLNNHSEEEESPRKNNRPFKLPDEFMEFSEDEQNISSVDSFEELEEKIKAQEQCNKIKLNAEKTRLCELFTRKIRSISERIALKTEDFRKFELNYLEILLKKTNEERLNFMKDHLISARAKEKDNVFPNKTSKDSKKLVSKFQRYLEPPKALEISSSSLTEDENNQKNLAKTGKNNKIKPVDEPRLRFRSLDEREIETVKRNSQVKPKRPRPSNRKRKDFVEINKKSLGFKACLSKPLFNNNNSNNNNNIISNNPNNSDTKFRKALERGNYFLKETNELKIEVKSAQMPPKTPVFESGRKKTDEIENFSTEDEKKKLLNNPKNTLMALLSNLNAHNTNSNTHSNNNISNPNTTNTNTIEKKPENIKDANIFNKTHISESCAFKISNYKSILDKETMKIIEQKKKKLLAKSKGFERGSEPEESEIEKIIENESFFSSCLNGFEYLLTPENINDKQTSKQLDEIAFPFENDSGIAKTSNNNNNSSQKASTFKKKKK